MSLTLLSGCGITGQPFFIRNYEDQPVKIHYKYLSKTEESTPFDYTPADTVMLANKLLKKKELSPFFKMPLHHFSNSIAVTKIDSISFTFELPSTASARIAPVYVYQDNLEYIVINQTDTIKFKEDYPKVHVEALYDKGIFKRKISIIGSSYSVLDIKLKEIKGLLKD